MFLELVDILRCPRDHEETWLVAAIGELRGRHIATGSLGCPVCRAEYPVVDGEVRFVPGEPAAQPAAGAPDAGAVLRARALLGLAEPGGVVALIGSAATVASALEEDAQVAFLLVNPAGVAQEPGQSTLRVGERLPLAPASLRGAMLGAEQCSSELVTSVVRALRPGGRLVAPATIPLPDGVTELARDDREWVGERSRVGSATLLQLKRQ